MNSKERVMAALAHREPDRVPIFEQEIASNIASFILGRRAYTGGGGIGWRDNAELMSLKGRDFLVRKLREDLVELHERLGMDAIRAPLVPEVDAEGPKKLDEYTYLYENETSWGIYRYEPSSMTYFLVDSSFRREGLPAVERFVDKIEDERIDLDQSAFEVMEDIVDGVGDDLAVTAASGIGIPLERAWLRALYERPRLVEVYLDYRVRVEIELIRNYKKREIDFVLGGGDIAGKNGPFYSPAIFKRIFLPRLKRIVDFCHELGLPYIYRTDGNVWEIARELFVESGVDGYGEIDASAGMRLADLRRSFPRLVLWGGVDCSRTLVIGSREDVINEVMMAIRDAGPGGGYILGSSNTIHPNVRLENFLTMLEAAKSFGAYPIKLT